MTLSEPRSSIAELLEHEEFLRRLALGLTRDAAAAEDLVQETWVVALQKSGARYHSPRAWLAKVARNIASARRRGARNRKGYESAWRPAQLPELPEDQLETRHLREQLERSIQGLSGEEQRCFELRFHHGLPPREIAAQTGLPVTRVYDRLKRGSKRVRRDLDREYGERRVRGGGWLSLGARVLGGLRALLPSGPAWLGLAAAAALAALTWLGWPAAPQTLAAASIEPSALAAGREAQGPSGEEVPSAASSRVALASLAATPTPSASPLSGSVQVTAWWQDPRERAAGVDLLCERDDPNSPEGAPSRARSAGDGVATFSELRPGTWRVSAGVGRARKVVVRPGEQSTLELELQRGVPVDLRVIDASGGPAAGAEVLASWPNRYDAWRSLGRADEAGLLRGPALDRRSWVRAVSPTGLSGPAVALGLGAEKGGTVVLEVGGSAGSVEVRVVDGDGAPLPGVTLALREGPEAWFDQRGAIVSQVEPQRATTDKDGRVALPTSGREPRLVAVESPGWPARAVELAATQDRLELTLGSPAHLSGQIRRADGSPAPHVFVSASSDALGPEPIKVRADANGRFALERLPAGRVHVRAFANNSNVSGFADARLRLRPGEEREWSKRLGPAPRIRGRALDARGRPASGAILRIESERAARGSSPYEVLRTRRGSVRFSADEDGGFSVPVFSDEPMRISWVRAPRFDEVLAWQEDVEAGRSATLRATPSSAAQVSIRGALVSPSGDPVRGGEVHVTGPLLLKGRRVEVDSKGSFSATRLNPATYRLRYWRPGRPAIELFGGDELDLSKGGAQDLGEVVVGE